MALEPRIDLRPYFQTLDEIDGPLNWGEFFGNDGPVELEVGTGRGLFLFNAGLQNPDVNFLGTEVNYKEARRGATRLQKHNVTNVRILGCDAKILLADRIAAETVSAVHVYFPDPWWKRRHKKRRVFDELLVREIQRVLIPGGLLHAWSDVQEYFDVMAKLVAANPAFGPQITPQERVAEHDMDYHTSFERKKRKLGLPIYRGQWARLQS